jgi:hypothetical protein
MSGWIYSPLAEDYHQRTNGWAPDILKRVKFSELVRILERNGFSHAILKAAGLKEGR